MDSACAELGAVRQFEIMLRPNNAEWPAYNILACVGEGDSSPSTLKAVIQSAVIMA
jgi:hypothetical protein